MIKKIKLLNGIFFHTGNETFLTSHSYIKYRQTCGGIIMDPTFIKESIRKVKKGDQQAFEPIVSFFQNRIFYHCYRMTGNAHEAEELAQEAFIRAYVNIDSFDQNRKFSTWLYRIATRSEERRVGKEGMRGV